jgi:predicted nuclease with TOPRIM domain
MARESMDDVRRQRDEAVAEAQRLRDRLTKLEALLDTVQGILNRARGAQ